MFSALSAGLLGDLHALHKYPSSSVLNCLAWRVKVFLAIKSCQLALLLHCCYYHYDYD